MQHLHSPKWRAARLIATGRLILASFSLLAVWLQPVEPGESAWILRSLLAAYAVYASGVLALSWRARAPLPYPIVRHVVDVLVFAAFLYRGAGVSSPLFPLLGFLLLAASLQWQSRGTLWTAGATLLAFGGMALHMTIWQPARFEVNEFIIRGVSLVVMALLLVEFGRYEARVRRDMQKLATEPRVAGGDVNEVARNLPSWTADVMGARRALIAWEEPDEPRLCLAWCEEGRARFAREAPGVLDPMVAPELANASFLCRRATGALEPVLCTSAGGFSRWQGPPLHPLLAERFAVTSVLSVRFETKLARGRLFLFDMPAMTSDDLLLGEIVARQVANCLGEIYLLRRLAERAVREERMRMGRDLHDGALHALAGVGLELENLLRTPEFGPSAARGRLRDIQTALETEQRTLRIVVERLRADGRDAPEPVFSLSKRLKGVVERIERQRGIRVEWSAADLDALPVERSDDLYFLLHEAMVNAARHSRASAVRLEASRRDGWVTVVVADNGHGFPFKGRSDLAELTARRLGPATLKERVAKLGGRLVIDSTEGGSQVRISLAAESAER